ncbi:MAG TPA: sigma-70 family RNA polymerase sigma factor [Tepidisphaeraceae bacterium]|jgi:RNA polymerase sigma factor (sigma-70 family)
MSQIDSLAEFISSGSQEAFACLVRQHIDMVYSAARRQVRDGQLAEDITQAVFIVLMKRGRSLRPGVPIVGWLLKTTYYASQDALRSEARRRKHEQKAAFMKEPFITANSIDISPELDRALVRLGEMDRGIVALRFMEDKSIQEIATALNISHDAAAKRLTRAIGKLRQKLLGGHDLSVALPVEAMLAAVPRLSAPAHLAGTSISLASSSSLSASSLIAKGAIKMMFWSHAKAAAILLAGGLAIGAGAMGAHSLVRAQTAAAPANATVNSSVATSATNSHRCIAQLSNGPSLEILGVAERDATGQPAQWWSADGSLLDFGPYAEMKGVSLGNPQPGKIEREVAVRLNTTLKNSNEPASVSWHLLDSGSAGSGTPQDEHGRYLSDIAGLLVQLSDNPSGAAVHVDFATGPWQTLITKFPDGSSSMGMGADSFLASECFEERGQTRMIFAITSTSNHGAASDAKRVIATTKSGKTVEGYIGSTTSSDNATILEITIPAPLNAIKKLDCQTRHWNQWLEIRHIALHADQKSNVQIVTSDQPGAQPTR